MGASYIFNVIGIPDQWGNPLPNPNTQTLDNKADQINRRSRFVLFSEDAVAAWTRAFA